MEDDKIIALYWARKEEAISETDRKYGSYCRSISFRILNDKEDSEECVNDTWLHTWNAIPPGKPEFLAGFLGKIVRNLSISKYRAGHAQKRGSGETQALLDELEECIPSGKSVEDEIEGRETAAAINRFLETLDAESRKIFVRRYFWAEPVKELAGNLNISEGKVKSQLFRMRAKLKMHLEKEGIALGKRMKSFSTPWDRSMSDILRRRWNRCIRKAQGLRMKIKQRCPKRENCFFTDSGAQWRQQPLSLSALAQPELHSGGCIRKNPDRRWRPMIWKG